MNNRKLAVVMAVAGGAVLALASLAGAQTSTSTTPTPNPAAHQMVLQVGPAGNALLRGTLVSVGSNSLVVTSWGGNWNISVAAGTQVMPKVTGSASDIASFKAGDYIGVQGKVDASAAWTIDATLVRDWSLRQTVNSNARSAKQAEQAGKQSGGQILEGTVSGASGVSFTLTVKGTAYTVQTSATTQILNRSWLKLNFSQIQNGDDVRVFGTVSGTTITASVVRDTSLPAAH